MKAYGNNIIVKADKAIDKTLESGIYVPADLQEKPVTATVVDCGPDVKQRLKPGDRVAYGKHAGTLVTLKGQEYTILLPQNVFVYGDDI